MVVWAAARYSRRVSHPILKDVQQRIADVTTQAEENVVGVRVVKAFAQEERETARFARRLGGGLRPGDPRHAASVHLRAGLSVPCPSLAIAAVLLVGGRQ